MLKEKLKRLKKDLKEWNKSMFGSLDKRIERKEKIYKLNMVDEALGLDEQEIVERNKERAMLFQDIKQNDGLLRQKARTKWIK